MIVITVTTDPAVHPERFSSFAKGYRNEIYLNQPNIGVVPAMQVLYEALPEYSILVYVHDDVTCHDPEWAARVLAEFEDPRVAIVGFGGATGIGVADIYKTRYEISQLQRIGYASNMRDWEVHGAYEAGAKDVAVVDGFFMAVRREFLRQIAGFKWFPHRFHCYDTALCLMAWRKGWKVRMTGVEVTHHGASFSASPEYKKWCHENGTTMEKEHEEPHRWMYDWGVARDLLPFRVSQ